MSIHRKNIFVILGMLFSLFLLPVLSSAGSYAFPVPWRNMGSIFFADLPAQGSIKIYTVMGKLVKTINLDAGHPDPVSWDVKNDAGENVASDVYIYRIEVGGNSGDVTKGKLVIIR
jgi:hypothetical protein